MSVTLVYQCEGESGRLGDLRDLKEGVENYRVEVCQDRVDVLDRFVLRLDRDVMPDLQRNVESFLHEIVD